MALCSPRHRQPRGFLPGGSPRDPIDREGPRRIRSRVGHADPRDVAIRWNPSPSEGVVSYVLSIGTSSGSYTSQVTLSNPIVSDGVWSQTVQLEDSADQYLALRALDDQGQCSTYSNEIVVEDVGPPEPLGTPGTPTLVTD